MSGGGPTPVQQKVDAYCAAWNATDPARRLLLLEQSWSADGRYVDPTADVRGRQALADHIGAFQRDTGATLTVTSAADAQGDRGRFTWEMGDPDGGVLIEGIDFFELDDDGRIARITGFFGVSPPTS